MQTEFKRSLPLSLSTLVDEVETAAGAEITVQLSGCTNRRMCGEITLSDPVRMVLTCGHGPEETSPAYPIPFAAFCHELLHLRRTFVERIPAIFRIEGMAYGPTDDHPVYTAECLQTFSVLGLEMALEHAVIEPRIPSYGIEYPMSFVTAEAWKTIPPLPWAHPHLQRWFCMDAWIKAQILTSDEQVKDVAERAMEKAGLLADARRLTDALSFLRTASDGVSAKEIMCLAACHAFQVHPAQMGLLYHIRPGYNELRPIPSSLAEVEQRAQKIAPVANTSRPGVKAGVIGDARMD